MTAEDPEQPARIKALREWQAEHDDSCETARTTDSVHYHKRTEPEAGMGPTCGAECIGCVQLFSPEAVADDCVRMHEGGAWIHDEGWICRGCAARDLLEALRENVEDYDALKELLGRDWP
jgi:hypothetical protein